MKYFIANWKANKNIEEANEWLTIFLSKYTGIKSNEITVIIAPPYPLLPIIKNKISMYPNILLASQDVSVYPTGSFTGEVPASTLAELANFVILGHNERRQYFHEDTDIINKKLSAAVQNGIAPILCIRDDKDFIHDDAFCVVYEPVSAIGTGNNESVDKIIEIRNRLKLLPGPKFIYGGSVDAKNVRPYLKTGEIDGFLIGKASLDPISFYQIVEAAL